MPVAFFPTTTAVRPGTPHNSTSAPASCYVDPEWLALLACYREGTSALQGDEYAVRQPAELRFEGEGTESAPADGGEEGRPEQGTGAWMQETFRRKGYLPAMKSPHEQQRQQTIHRYGLHKPAKVEAIDALCALARNVFDCPMVILNLVLEDRIVFLSSSGWTDSERDPSVPPATFELSSAMCSHAMSKDPDAGCWVVPDVLKDWRFAQGPYCQDGKGPVQFFASANVNLPAAVAPGEPPRLLPVGSFCLIDSKPRDLPEKQQDMLKQFANMAAKEIELVFHKERGTMGELRNDFVDDLFRSLLVYPSRVLCNSFEERCSVDALARSLLTHSRADFSYILDLRNFNFDYSLIPTTTSPDPSSSSNSSSLPGRPGLPRRATQGSQHSRRSFSRHDTELYGRGSIGIVDCWCAESEANGGDLGEEKEEWTRALNSPGGLEAISGALATYHGANKRTRWACPDVKDTPLATILPAETTSYVATPIFDNEGEPALLVVVGSRERHFAFDDSDERFVSTVGGILKAAMLQEKILAADEAKLAFVGSVSHELRTPIFAIAGNLQLVREQISPEALEQIEPLLDVAGCCLDTLKDILDDCLEYSKFSNHRRQAPSVTAVKSDFTRCNVIDLVTDVIKSCWSKEKRFAEMMDRKEEGEGVAVVLESHIPPEMEAMLDVGGLKRVGVNLLGNALKFTSRGTITIRLSEATPTSPPSSPSGLSNMRYIRFEAIDSGKGMSQDFLRESLFTPFKQADPFAVGAGLGVSLSAQMVERMGGKISFSSELGVGTTAMVIIPAEIIPSTSAEILPSTSKTPLPYIHNFSNELNDLARGRRSPKPTGKPARLEHRPSKSSKTSSARSTSRNTREGAEDRKRTEELATGIVETLGEATADVKVDDRAVPELDGPLEDNAGNDQVRVLVVDDNTIARRILCAFLKSKKITFTEASGGAQAIELFGSFRPNLVWCDIQMPEVDGIQATREMRRHEEREELSPARIIAVSGLDSDLGEHGELLQSGQLDRWIVKGSTSLRTLAADMLEYAKRLASFAPSPLSSPSLSSSSSSSPVPVSSDSDPSAESSPSPDTPPSSDTSPPSSDTSPPSDSPRPSSPSSKDVSRIADHVEDIHLDA